MSPRLRLEAWCSLDPSVALLVLSNCGGEPGVAPLDAPADAFPTTSCELATANGHRCLVLVRPANGRHVAEGIAATDGTAIAGWSAADMADARREPDEVLVDHLVGLDDGPRTVVVRFLVEAALVGPGDGRGLSHELHRFREALRPRSPLAVVDARRRSGGVVETFVRIDDHTAYLRGWLAWTREELRSVTAVSPEGERVEVAPMLRRSARPDVDSFYGRDPGATAGLGMATVLTTVGGSRLDDGWFLQVEAIDGTVVEVPAPTAVSNADAVRDTLVAELAIDDERHSLCEQHLWPALERLAERRVREVHLDTVDEHGPAPAAPVATVVVPLYRRLDLMEYQLGQFSIDPTMADVDLVYVLDSPEQADELRAAASRWYRLYRQPFRLAVTSANGGFSLANNLGADLARGAELVLCNSDVVPVGPGWVGDLIDARNTAAAALGGPDAVGAVGARLLYEDGSLQHAGMYFDRATPDAPWTNEHYFKGLHHSFAPSTVARRVPALTAACMTVRLDRFRSVGGLSTSYVQGDYEDSDLCLRLAADGAACWYAGNVSLHHLEGGSYPSPDRTRFGGYNQWLHERRWGATIEALMASGPFTPAEAVR